MTEDHLKELEWQAPPSEEPRERAMFLTADILGRAREGLQPGNEYQVCREIQELLALRGQAGHQVNQGMRAIVDCLLLTSYRGPVLDELVNVVEGIAVAVMINCNILPRRQDDIADILGRAWLKVLGKLQKFADLRKRLARDEKLPPTQELKGIFNPLCSDFVAWFGAVAVNAARDHLKIAGRRQKRIKTWDNFTQVRGDLGQVPGGFDQVLRKEIDYKDERLWFDRDDRRNGGKD